MREEIRAGAHSSASMETSRLGFLEVWVLLVQELHIKQW